jgi:hypothetical protein
LAGGRYAGLWSCKLCLTSYRFDMKTARYLMEALAESRTTALLGKEPGGRSGGGEGRPRSPVRGAAEASFSFFSSLGRLLTTLAFKTPVTPLLIGVALCPLMMEALHPNAHGGADVGREGVLDSGSLSGTPAAGSGAAAGYVSVSAAAT